MTSNEQQWLAERFEENRPHLRAVAYRMLGASTEADDAVQETWLRLGRADTDSVENLRGWLTTVIARVCLDMLRSRKSRREEPLDVQVSESVEGRAEGTDPEHEALLGDAVGIALFVVLETLAPAERLAFVLHDLFGVSFDDIAPIVERTPTAARQLASRARRRVKGASATRDANRARQQELVTAFRAAARGGNFDALLSILDPNVVLRADHAAVALGAMKETRGAAAVANTFSGRAEAAKPAVVDGAAGLAWVVGGNPRVVFRFTVAHGVIAAIDLIAAPEHLARINLTIVAN